jgi:hypothetical protein
MQTILPKSHLLATIDGGFLCSRTSENFHFHVKRRARDDAAKESRHIWQKWLASSLFKVKGENWAKVKIGFFTRMFTICSVANWWPTTLGGSFGFKTPRFPAWIPPASVRPAAAKSGTLRTKSKKELVRAVQRSWNSVQNKMSDGDREQRQKTLQYKIRQL